MQNRLSDKVCLQMKTNCATIQITIYIDLMGVEEAVYAVADCPETVEEYFEALHEIRFRLIDVINASPVKIINFGDNIHSGTLPSHLILGISDEISSTGDIERIRLVGRMVDEYNEKIENAACAQA